MPEYRTVFISHDHTDNNRCANIASYLTNRGINVWIDLTDAQQGRYLDKAIERELTGRTAFVLMVSVTSNTSKWVADELGAFRSLRNDLDMRYVAGVERMILPVRLSDRIPLLLQGIYWIDAINRADWLVARDIADAIEIGDQSRNLTKNPQTPPQPLYDSTTYTPPQPPYVPLTAPPSGYSVPNQPSYLPPTYPTHSLTGPLTRFRRGGVLGIVGIVMTVLLIGACIVLLTFQRGGGTSTLYSNTMKGTISGSSSDWANDDTCFDGSDGYHAEGNHVCFNTSASNVGDATYSATAFALKMDSATSYGIAFREANLDYYSFKITQDGYWAFYKVSPLQSGLDPEMATTISNPTSNSAIHTGANVTNKLMVVAQGSHFTFFVNGTQVGQADDSTYASGEWGLDAGFNSASTEIVFTNVLVTDP